MKLAIIVTILQLIAYSALATDCLQTQHWIAGTRDDPILSPFEFSTYELNPILAGHPELRKPYFDFLASTVEIAPTMLSPPLSVAYVGYIAIGDTLTAIRNNALSRQAGFPEYWVLSWRWSW